MEKAHFVMSTDWHIKKDNTNQKIELIRQQIELSKKLGVINNFCLGDVFDSRQAQPLIVLKCFETILDMFQKANIMLYCFPGNHEKTNYESKDSFLDQFYWHPSLILIKEYDIVSFGKFNLHLIPYFDEENWLKEFYKLKCNGEYTDILISHQAFTGSVNNDGSEIKNSLDPSIVSLFYKVFLGHYHNQHKIGKNIYHLPSLEQTNFAENSDKGFTVFYSDGSHELVKSKFNEFETVDVDLEEISNEELNQILSELKDEVAQGLNARIRFTGSDDKLDAIRVDEIKQLGIKVKKNRKSIIESIEEAEQDNFVEFNDSTIVEEFHIFSKKEKYEDKKVGLKYLERKLS